MRLLDRSESELLSLLRQAESIGLARLKSGGGVVQINVRDPIAQLLEIPELADRRLSLRALSPSGFTALAERHTGRQSRLDYAL
jgi:hypothetical protein